MAKLSFNDVLQITAFVPSYVDGVGQGLIVYCRDGTTLWLEQGMRPFIMQLAKLFAINLRDARKKYGMHLGQVNLVPLALSPFLVFVPLKVLNPKVSGDPAYGYFRLRSLTGLCQSPAPCTLQLEGGVTVTLRQSQRTARSRLRAAKKLEELLLEEFYHTMDISHHFFMADVGLLPGFLQENGAKIWNKRM